MAATLLTFPPRATLATGVIAPGAKMYLYQTGTTTPQAGYTSKTLGTPHANPVVADSGGKFAPIYLNPALSYRAVIKTSDDATTLYDIDPIGDDNLSSLNSTATGEGASLIKLQDGRTVQRALNPTLENTFWGNAATAYIARLADRVLMGAAVDNVGLSTSNEDWIGQLATSPTYIYNGAQAANGNDLTYAQAAVLADPDCALASTAVPQIGFFSAIMSKNAVTDSTPRAFQSIAWNNCGTSGQTPTIWAQYIEAHVCTTNAANTYGIELGVRALASVSTAWNPYTQPGRGLIGLELQAGCGLPSTGQFNATCAAYIAANPMKFGSGIIFFDGAIAAAGIGSSKPAIQMPWDNRIQWMTSATTIGGQTYGDSFGNFYIDTPTSGGRTILTGGLSVNSLANAANDAAAAGLGIQVNQLYRNGSVVMVRVS